MSQPGHAVAALLARARAGDMRAVTALGKRLLVGDGVKLSTDQGLAMLREAAARGDGEAAAQLAVCAAWGVGHVRDLNAALDYLVRAAQLGLPSARRELQLLARDTGEPSALRHKIDLAACAAAPLARTVFTRPHISVIAGFATADECRWLIDRGSADLQRAKVYRGSSTAQIAQSRTNTETSFTIFNADVMLSLIRDRIAAVTGMPVSHFEVAKALHYAPGEQFALHADFIEAATPELARELAVRGQRAATFLLYLNDGYEGGATQFPKLRWEYKGAPGDALLFSNIDPAGAPDYDTVHAGLPPTTGEKWVLSQWIRTLPIAAS